MLSGSYPTVRLSIAVVEKEIVLSAVVVIIETAEAL